MRENKYVSSMGDDNEKVKQALERIKNRPQKKPRKNLRRTTVAPFHHNEVDGNLFNAVGGLLHEVKQELAKATRSQNGPTEKQDKMRAEREAYHANKDGLVGDDFKALVDGTIKRLHADGFSELECAYVVWSDAAEDFHNGNARQQALLAYIGDITKELSGAIA